MKDLAIGFALVLVLAVIPAAYLTWYRLDVKGHPWLGGLLAGAVHATMLILAGTILLAVR